MIIACEETVKGGVKHSKIVWQHTPKANQKPTIDAINELTEKFDRETIKTLHFYNCQDVTNFFLRDT